MVPVSGSDLEEKLQGANGDKSPVVALRRTLLLTWAATRRNSTTFTWTLELVDCYGAGHDRLVTTRYEGNHAQNVSSSRLLGGRLASED